MLKETFRDHLVQPPAQTRTHLDRVPSPVFKYLPGWRFHSVF